jgi:hypothetical protein
MSLVSAVSRGLPTGAARLGLVAVSLLTAATAQAQTLRLTGTQSGAPTTTVATRTTKFGPSTTWTYAGGTSSYTASPYLATYAPIGGSPMSISVICVDLLNTASFHQTYAVNVTSLASASLTLTDTRWVSGMKQQNGTGWFGTATYETLSNANAMTRYRMASYLGAFMQASNKAEWNDIQLAIWEIMTPYTVRNDVSAWTSTNAATWLAQATAAANAGFLGYDFSQVLVLTDATVDDGSPEVQGVRAQNGRQEFVTAARTAQVVPEPSTYLLLGTGIAALGLVARRRRTR